MTDMEVVERLDIIINLLYRLLPEPKREEAFVERHPAEEGYNLRHWKFGIHTSGVLCPCGPERVPHKQVLGKPTPADDFPGEPVEPGDLRAGDRVEFTYFNQERITCALVRSPSGTALSSDVPCADGYYPLVTYRDKVWVGGISDVRLIERGDGVLE